MQKTLYAKVFDYRGFRCMMSIDDSAAPCDDGDFPLYKIHGMAYTPDGFRIPGFDFKPLPHYALGSTLSEEREIIDESRTMESLLRIMIDGLHDGTYATGEDRPQCFGDLGMAGWDDIGEKSIYAYMEEKQIP
jgi:hypothetical protein